MNYTGAQQRAIETIDRNLQIIACAGSGKTQVISRRIVEILRNGKQNGVVPANIVAFTFTEKAAAELKDRIHRLAIEVLGDDTGFAEMYVGTIHGYCLNLLQRPPVYKFLKYSVLTEVQQRLLIDRNSAKSGLNSVPLLNGGTLKRWLDSALWQQLLSVLEESDVDRRRVSRAVLEAAERYGELRDAKRLLDYSGMLSAAVKELGQNAQLRASVAGQLKYLVVDEYQDVNPLQEQLISEIARLGANICVVGDDDQTIYQWRGSEVKNIIEFANRYPRVKAIRLDDNFRSSQGIVLAARHVIEGNSERLRKKMESTKAQSYERGDVLALSFDSPEDEAQWIAEKASSLYSTAYCNKQGAEERGLAYSDIAVLLRSVRNDAGPILAALDTRRIPYIVGGMNGLFDTPEVQAMRDVFYYLAQHEPRGSSVPDKRHLTKLFSDSLWDLSSTDIKQGIRFLEDRKRRIGDRMDADLYLQRVYLDLLEGLGIREDRITQGADARRGEIVFYNLGKFSQVISDFETINFHSAPKSLYSSFAGFLEYQAPDYYPEGWEEAGYAQPDAVNVMTVHQAKGMQWPVVFVPCLRRNRFPSHDGRADVPYGA
jgi:DNA helicase-2/ATP-dependent DNA helicase PcrA